MFTSFISFNHREDEVEFMIALLENINGGYSNNKIPLPEICFNPFEVNDNNNFLLNCRDIDPDLNYFNTFKDNLISKYMIAEEFNQMTNSLKQNNFSTLHINCKSL